jgi:hypothetical protein
MTSPSTSPTPTTRKPAWPGVAARFVGFWILAGCAAKATLGTPADLPTIVRQAPFALGTTFALALGLEAFVGIAMMLRPGRAWPLAALLLVAFVAVLATQLAAGSKSCGCFGAKLPVPPWAMLAADATFLGLLIASRPWTLARGGVNDLAMLAAALVVAIAVPWIADREATSATTPGEVATGRRKWASFDVESWKGKKIGDIELAKWADLSGASDGVWFVYRESCEVCAACLERVTIREQGEREITLVRLGETGEEATHRAVHMLPQGGFVHTINLPDTVDWVVTAPARLVVENGVVTFAKQGIAPEDCP